MSAATEAWPGKPAQYHDVESDLCFHWKNWVTTCDDAGVCVFFGGFLAAIAVGCFGESPTLGILVLGLCLRRRLRPVSIVIQSKLTCTNYSWEKGMAPRRPNGGQS